MTSPGSDRVDESAPEIRDCEVVPNGSRVHYLTAGDGPPHLVLLHGLGDIVGRKSRARPLGLNCAATQGSYCMTPQEYDQLRHSSRLERERKRQLELEDARRRHEQKVREWLEQDEALRRQPCVDCNTYTRCVPFDGHLINWERSDVGIRPSWDNSRGMRS